LGRERPRPHRSVRSEGNQTLDYKASAALLFKDKKPLSGGTGTLGEKHRQDMIRDVASMANAEGGLIIYGVVERSGESHTSISDTPILNFISASNVCAPKTDETQGNVRHKRLQ
jgi:hypothetical protein